MRRTGRVYSRLKASPLSFYDILFGKTRFLNRFQNKIFNQTSADSDFKQNT